MNRVKDIVKDTFIRMGEFLVRVLKLDRSGKGKLELQAGDCVFVCRKKVIDQRILCEENGISFGSVDWRYGGLTYVFLRLSAER